MRVQNFKKSYLKRKLLDLDKTNLNIDTARHKGWAEMQTLLDKEMPQKGKRINLFVYLPYAATLVLLVVAGFNLFSPSTKTINNSESENIALLEPISERKIHVPFQQNYSIAQPQHATTTNQSNNQRLVEKISTSLSNEGIVQNKSFDLVPKQNQAKTVLPTNKQSTLVAQESAPAKQAEAKIDVEDQQDINRQQLQTKKFTSNQKEQKAQQMNGFDLRTAFTKPKIDLGVSTHGSIGFVSKDLTDYGMRVGFELRKPLNKDLSLNTGIRYSAYKDAYNNTYQVGDFESDNYLVEELSTRNVDRSFIEIPVYADLSLHENLKVKGGVALTYNKNNSADARRTTNRIVQNTNISLDDKVQAGTMLDDQQGYLGEAVLGTTFIIDRVSLDVEGTYGIISNQKIDNRNIVGARLSYRIGSR